METKSKTLAVEFATNLFGRLRPDIKKRLQKVIENPTEKNWEDSYTIILNMKGTFITLWQSVIAVDPSFQRNTSLNLNCDSRWTRIPDSKTLIKAVQWAVFPQTEKELN